MVDHPGQNTKRKSRNGSKRIEKIEERVKEIEKMFFWSVLLSLILAIISTASISVNVFLIANQ